MDMISYAVAILYFSSFASAATTTTPVSTSGPSTTTDIFTDSSNTTYFSSSSTDFTRSVSDSTTDDSNSTVSSTDFFSSSTNFSSSSTYFSSSSSTDNEVNSSFSTTSLPTSESSPCWWCTSSWPSTLWTLVHPGAIGGRPFPLLTTSASISTTPESDEYPGSERGFTGITSMSIAAVGGIVVGCAAIVSLVVIVIAIKAFGGGGSVAGVSSMKSAPDGRWAKPQPYPPNQNHSVGAPPQYTYGQQQQQAPPNKYADGHVVDFY